MKVLDPGHHYSLDWLDGNPKTVYDGYDLSSQNELIFVKREGDKYPGNVGHHPGTTMQEVLRALIDRANYVCNQNPCDETEEAIIYMTEALIAFEMRAARIHGREFLESTPENLQRLISGEGKCEKCGHVGCDGKH